MSEDKKPREDAQPLPVQAPANAKSNDTKDQPEPQHSFQDWAAI